MATRHYWEENGHPVKYDYNANDGLGRVAEQLNFAAPSEDEAEYPPGAYLKKAKVSRQDPMSHRIIEKRRRDRMNNCLADLSRLIPPEYLKKGRGRVEKTEIIEMAIRHLKYLQDRANAAERQAAEDYRAGYQEAASEASRFLVKVQGYDPADGLCTQLTSHLQRHCEAVSKGEIPREKHRSHPGSSSETASSSSSSHGYVMKPMEPQAQPPAPTYTTDNYETDRIPELPYNMECEQACHGGQEGESRALDGRRRPEPTLRAIRKPEHADDYLHSYKFKNSIERRFSRSQGTEPSGPSSPQPQHGKYGSKRRRAAQLTPCTSTSGSAEDVSPQDTSSESPHHHHYDKHPPPTQYVPVFALNAIGKYYVPLSVDYACLAPHMGASDVLHARAVPLHPVTLHVNFQPCLNYHVKHEPNERNWPA